MCECAWFWTHWVLQKVSFKYIFKSNFRSDRNRTDFENFTEKRAELIDDKRKLYLFLDWYPRKEDINWFNVDPHLRRYMMSLYNNQ